LSKSTQDYIQKYWSAFKDKAQTIKPKEGKISVQNNMRMPWTTGVSDVIIKKESEREDEKISEEITVWEIKASIDPEWKEDALIQAVVYSWRLTPFVVWQE